LKQKKRQGKLGKQKGDRPDFENEAKLVQIDEDDIRETGDRIKRHAGGIVDSLVNLLLGIGRKNERAKGAETRRKNNARR